MAHLGKYKSPDIGALSRHCDRHHADPNQAKWTYQNQNIDPSRTALNYRLGGDFDVPKRIAETRHAVAEKTGRAVRKDAVLMGSWVITAPEGLRAGDERRFFEAAYRFISDRYGEENMLGGFVHMDETTPHMHTQFMPIIDGKFSFKKMCPREEYQHFHSELNHAIDAQLGYHVQVLRDERDWEDEVTNTVPQKYLDDAKREIEALKQERDVLAEEVEQAHEVLSAFQEAVHFVNQKFTQAPHVMFYWKRLERLFESNRFFQACESAYERYKAFKPTNDSQADIKERRRGLKAAQKDVKKVIDDYDLTSASRERLGSGNDGSRLPQAEKSFQRDLR